MDWNLEAIDRLRKMWAEGLSTAEIGRRMGVSKNAIVGKAHRLNLSTRPSPIRRDPAAPRVTQLMTPRMKEIIAEAHIAEARKKRRLPKAEERVETDEPPPPAARELPKNTKEPSKPRKRHGDSETCCWPIGDPGTSEFRFCEEEPAPGKPYCAEHAAIAYVKPRGDASKNDVA
jgi:GcrA cell cycle regulator